MASTGEHAIALWWVWIDSDRHGPFNLDELQQLLRLGRVNESARVVHARTQQPSTVGQILAGAVEAHAEGGSAVTIDELPPDQSSESGSAPGTGSESTDKPVASGASTQDSDLPSAGTATAPSEPAAAPRAYRRSAFGPGVAAKPVGRSSPTTGSRQSGASRPSLAGDPKSGSHAGLSAEAMRFPTIILLDWLRHWACRSVAPRYFGRMLAIAYHLGQLMLLVLTVSVVVERVVYLQQLTGQFQAMAMHIAVTALLIGLPMTLHYAAGKCYLASLYLIRQRPCRLSTPAVPDMLAIGALFFALTAIAVAVGMIVQLPTVGQAIAVAWAGMAVVVAATVVMTAGLYPHLLHVQLVRHGDGIQEALGVGEYLLRLLFRTWPIGFLFLLLGCLLGLWGPTLQLIGEGWGAMDDHQRRSLLLWHWSVVAAAAMPVLSYVIYLTGTVLLGFLARQSGRSTAVSSEQFPDGLGG